MLYSFPSGSGRTAGKAKMVIAGLAIVAGIVGTLISLIQDPIEQERK
jgi:hypothetical protein